MTSPRRLHVIAYAGFALINWSPTSTGGVLLAYPISRAEVEL